MRSQHLSMAPQSTTRGSICLLFVCICSMCCAVIPHNLSISSLLFLPCLTTSRFVYIDAIFAYVSFSSLCP